MRKHMNMKHVSKAAPSVGTHQTGGNPGVSNNAPLLDGNKFPVQGNSGVQTTGAPTDPAQPPTGTGYY